MKKFQAKIANYCRLKVDENSKPGSIDRGKKLVINFGHTKLLNSRELMAGNLFLLTKCGLMYLIYFRYVSSFSIFEKFLRKNGIVLK